MRAGAIADARGDYGRAEAHYRVALQLRRDGGDLAGAVGALNNLGALAHSQADHDAVTLLVRAGPGARTRDRRRTRHRNGAGEHGNRRGRERRACAGSRAARGEHCAQRTERLGQHYALAISRQALGSALLDLGRYEPDAAAHRSHALAMHQEQDDPLGTAVTLEELAAFAAAVGDGERAAVAARRRRLPSATASARRSHAVDEGRRARTESAARDLIGSERYDEAYRDGLTAEPDAAVEAALAGCRRIAAATGGSASVD